MAATDQVIAEIAVEPVVSGDTHRDLVHRAVEALRGPDLRVEAGAMSTVVAGSVDDVLHAVQRAHTAVSGSVDRVVTTVRLETAATGVDLDARAREVGTG